MSAGIPGLGLGGLFFIFSALLAPLRQLRRSRRGEGGPGEWRSVGRQFAQAVGIILAIDLSLRLVRLALAAVGVADGAATAAGTVIPLSFAMVTTILLAAVLGAAKVADVVVRIRGGEATVLSGAAPGPPGAPLPGAGREPSEVALLVAAISDPGSAE